MKDLVMHPDHYTYHPSGLECWDINSDLTGNLAAAFKYVFRREHKNTVEQNLEKAIQYLRKERQLIANAISRKQPARILIQPGRDKRFIQSIRLVVRHEHNQKIKGFYLALAGLARVHAPVQQLNQLTICASRLGAFLTDLDELAVRSTSNNSHR